MGLFGFGKKGPAPVLVIDDQDDVRSLLKDALESFGCAVVEADNSKDGIAMAEKHTPTPPAAPRR